MFVANYFATKDFVGKLSDYNNLPSGQLLDIYSPDGTTIFALFKEDDKYSIYSFTGIADVADGVELLGQKLLFESTIQGKSGGSLIGTGDVFLISFDDGSVVVSDQGTQDALDLYSQTTVGTVNYLNGEITYQGESASSVEYVSTVLNKESDRYYINYKGVVWK